MLNLFQQPAILVSNKKSRADGYVSECAIGNKKIFDAGCALNPETRLRMSFASFRMTSAPQRCISIALLLLIFCSTNACASATDPLAMPTLPTTPGMPASDPLAGGAAIPLPTDSAMPAAEEPPAQPATPSLSKPPKRTLSPEKAGRHGNWAKKRRWLKEALAENEALQKNVSTTQRMRSKFLDAFNGIDKKVNDFYRTRGFSQGTLDALIKDVRDDVTQEKERRIAHAKEKSEEGGVPLNYYDVQIEAIEEDTKKFEKEVTQFKLDVESVKQLDGSLNERLKVLDTHLKEVGSLGGNAQNLTDDIWLMIDDKKARSAYYELKGVGERVTGIKQYVEGALLGDFKKVIGTLDTHLMQVGDEVGKLERRGLVIEHRGERLKNKQRSFLAQRMHDEVGDEEEEAVVEKPRRRRRKAPEQSIMQRILSPFRALYDMLFGGSTPKVRKRRRTAERTEP